MLGRARDELRAVLACTDHDPSPPGCGMWAYLDNRHPSWFAGPPDWNNPGDVYSMRAKWLSQHPDGSHIVSVVDQRLAAK